MIVSQSVTDRVNQQPINQHARALLQQVGVRPDPTLPYLLQLMRWALESGEVKPKEALRSLLETNLEVLEAADPREALPFLLELNGEDLLSEREILAEEDPVALAEALWETLYLRLQPALPQP